MAQTRRTSANRTGRSGTGQYRSRNMYVYDNTARNLDIQRQLEEDPRRKLSHEARKNRDKAHHMSLGYVMFLVVALCACAVILINYIQLQAEMTAKVQNIAKLESRLNSMKLENDEAYNRITSSIDLEEIKRIAIGELGMTYAQEGQIVTYSGIGNDYMRVVADDN
ncbi:MAG: cell division protein FtsL [Acetatifactor sp.]|nr:cell division protein FtsL [Acetatifactor sp.]